MTQKNLQSPTDEEIARYAYFLWESEGKIHGRDLDYWLQAKAHLTAAREHEASLAHSIQPTQKIATQSERIIPMPRITPKPQRKRSSRTIREPEPAWG